MPIARFQTPDGRIARFDVPDGTTPEQAQAAIEAAMASGGQQGSLAQQAGQQATSDTPTWERGLVSLGRGLTDVGQGVKQIALHGAEAVGAVPRGTAGDYDRQVADELALYKPFEQQVMGSSIGRATGGALPTLLLPAGKAAQGVGTVVSKLAPQAGARLGQSALLDAAVLGGAQGGAMVADQGETHLGNALAGAAGGAGAVAGVNVARAVSPAVLASIRASAEPFYKGGQEAILGRLLNRVAGSEAPQAAANLRAAAQPYVGAPAPGEAARTIQGEIVPGSMPTVGQASGNAGIASLERAANAIEPSSAVQAAAQFKAQNAARIAQVEGVAGTGAEREAADLERSVKADKLYSAARKAGIDKDVAEAMKPQVDNLLERMPTGVMEKAKELARMNGEAMGPEGSINGLHYIKKGVDDLLSSAKQTGIGSETQRALAQFKSDLMSTISDLSPAYAKANAQYAKMSGPINQMDVGAAMLDKGVNKVTGTLEPGKYINNLTDKTAQQATGFNRATLEGTLTNAQLNKLNSVVEDLQRSVRTSNSAGGPGSDTVKKLAYSNMVDAAGIPTWVRNFAPAQIGGNLLSRGADALYGRANVEMSSALAALMRDPAKAAAVMEATRSPGNTRLRALLADEIMPRALKYAGAIGAQEAAQQ